MSHLVSRTGATPARVAEQSGALAVVLRAEEQGPALAVGLVSDRDLADARAELWFEAFLRRGRLDVSLEDVRAEPLPIHHDLPPSVGTGDAEGAPPVGTGAAQAAPPVGEASTPAGAGDPSVRRTCLGFSLVAESAPGDTVRCIYPRRSLEPVALRLLKQLDAASPPGDPEDEHDADSLADPRGERGDDYANLEGEDLDKGRVFYEVVSRPRVEHEARPAPRRGAAVVAPVQVTAPEPFTALSTPLAPLRERAEAKHAEEGVDDDYPVFFTREALARAEKAARRGAASQPPVETGGLLVGPLCTCPETGEMFSVVVDVLEAVHAQGTKYSLTYSGSTWARIETVRRAWRGHPKTRHHRLLGQVHGHSFLPLGGAEPCEDCAAREVCSRTSAFLSPDDRAWCRAVFRCEPWQLSQVFGLDALGRGVEAFYGQRGGVLVPRGYFLIDDFES